MEVKAKKSLGQNFLNDSNVLEKIAFSTSATKNDLIIEIGAGKGALTKKIKSIGAKIIAFEIDERMKSFLDCLEDDRTTIIYQDILKEDIQEKINLINYEKLYVIANIPYYITTPIIKKLLDSKLAYKEIVLLVQKEFAERLTAHPGSKEYGSLTVYLSYFYSIRKLFDVNRQAFSPSPKVDSVVIKLEPKEKIITNEDKLFELIKESFKFKRKTLKKNLSNFNWPIISQLLKDKGYKDNVRAEELPVEIFVEIANHI